MIKTRLLVFKKKFFADITEVPEVFKVSHFPGLDGLRGISIIFVILAHCLIGLSSWPTYFKGRLGVDIFFVISGFLITTLLLKEKVNYGKVSFKGFYIRRFLRIFPVAYLYLIVLIFINQIFALKIPKISFLSAAFYVMNFPIHHGKTWYTGHFWSLSVEEQFYLIFPVLLVFKTNAYVIVTTIITLILPFTIILAFSNYGIFYSIHILHNLLLIFNNLFEHGACSIFIGSIFSILIFKNIISIEKIGKFYYLSFLFFLLALLEQTVEMPNPWYFLWHDLFSVIIGLVILLNLNGENFFLLILNNPLIIRIGVLSYSLYVWQELFTYNQPWKHSYFIGSNVFLNLIILFFVAYLSFNFYEKFFLKIKSRFKKSN